MGQSEYGGLSGIGGVGGAIGGGLGVGGSMIPTIETGRPKRMASGSKTNI